MRILICLIVISLVIQNTCPYGWAAKSAFVSSKTTSCPHCPMEQNRRADSDTSKDVKKDFSNINHLFVIHIGISYAAFQVYPFVEQAPLLKSDQIEDVYMEPPLRPPSNLKA